MVSQPAQARRSRGGIPGHVAALARLVRGGRGKLAGLLVSERILPASAVLLVLISAVVSLSPSPDARAATGAVDGDDPGPRIAIGGQNGSRSGDVLSDGIPAREDLSGGLPALTSLNALGDVAEQAGGPDIDVSVADGGFLEDGTLLKPVAVDTSVADGRGLLVSYTVRANDTLTGIASRHGVSMMTIWWANALTSKDDLKLGQVLIVPTVDGLVVDVAEGDTIEGLAQRFGVDPGEIISVNGLEDPNLVIGQTLIMPGARGDAIAEPSPTPAPRAPRRSTTTARPPATYAGGAMRWPVVGGGSYVSQYYHYGHYGIDIAADYGTPVVAAAGGTVLFAGWKSNGGGYQVWLAHGSGLYTTYNHMSAVTVGRGQSVGRGQQVGRIGQTGWATGPHLHFEVWSGPIWDGGSRVNPARYL
jgi:murein DD-endopeptidase MepM/ murein hydrolase activator NlpD